VSGGTGGQVPFQGIVEPSQHCPGGGSAGQVDVSGIIELSQQVCISTGRPPLIVKASEIVTTSCPDVNLIPLLRSVGSQPVVSIIPDQDGSLEVSTVSLIVVKLPEL
jgi:hypothetical protein